MGYWLPGGGLDEGEGLREGALREVWEEAGVHVTLSSLLEVRTHMYVNDFKYITLCACRGISDFVGLG